MNETLKQLLFFARYLQGEDTQTVVGVILKDLGFRSNKRGFMFLKVAVELYHEDPAQLITCGLYLEMSKYFNRRVSKAQIEVSIRRAIKAAWLNRSQTVWDLYFPGGITTRKTGPSNTEFISGMSDLLELWEVCCRSLKNTCGEVYEHE